MLRYLIRARGVAIPPEGWDADSVVNGGTIDEGGFRFLGKGSGTWGHVRSARAITGNRYFSFEIHPASWGGGVVAAGIIADGVAFDSAHALGTQHYGTQSCGGYRPTSGWFSNGVNVSVSIGNNTLEFAVRASSRRVWCRVNGGAWIGGGDPVADTSPTFTLGGTGALRAAGCTGRSDVWVRIHAASATTGTPPSGFTVGL